MNTLALLCMIGIGALFFINLTLFLFGGQLFKKGTIFHNWKTQVLFISIASVLFFIYFTNTLTSAGYIQTITDGSDTFTYKNNSYVEAFNYLYLIGAMYAIQWFFLIYGIFEDLKLLGRNRLENHE